MEAEKYTVYRNRFFYRANGKMIPRSHKVWLDSNPLFKEIPEGYVIHHLDGDSTNDDPSNLVLMRFHLHAAYHYKYIKPEVEVTEVSLRDPSLIYEPIKDIKVQKYQYRKGRWQVRYRGKAPNGHKRTMRFYSNFDGNALDSEEMALKFANELSAAFNVPVNMMPVSHLSTAISSL